MSYEPPPHYSDFANSAPIWKKWFAGFWRHTEESGLWTPQYSSSGTAPSSITYDQESGVWIRRGTVLHAWFEIGTDALTVGTGDLRVTGLPRSNASALVAEAKIHAFNFVGSDATFNSAKPFRGYVATGNDYLAFQKPDTTQVDATATYLATGSNSNRIRGYVAFQVEV